MLWIYNYGSDTPIPFEVQIPAVFDVTFVASALVTPTTEMLYGSLPAAALINLPAFASLILALPMVALGPDAGASQHNLPTGDISGPSNVTLPEDTVGPDVPDQEQPFAAIDPMRDAARAIIDELLLAMDAPWMTEDVYDFVHANGVELGARAVASLLTPIESLANAAWRLADVNGQSLPPEHFSAPSDNVYAGDQPEVMAGEPEAFNPPAAPVQHELAGLPDQIASADLDRVITSVILVSGVLGSAYYYRRRQYVREFNE
jgi:hypothetical protein